MQLVQRIITGLAVTIGLGVSTPAMAEPIFLDGSSIGEVYSITFDGFVDDDPSLPGLSSQLSLTLNSIVNGVYNFDYSLTNTGATDDSISSRVSSFAFNTDPEITGASSTGTYNFATIDSSYPNGIGSVDVCFKGASTGSCPGGAGAGVFDGQSGTGTLALDFGGAIAGLTLDDFFVRYQAIEGIAGVTSASGRQTAGSTSSTSGGSEVPAPGMLVIFAMALLGLFYPKGRQAALRRGGEMPVMAHA